MPESRPPRREPSGRLVETASRLQFVSFNGRCRHQVNSQGRLGRPCSLWLTFNCHLAREVTGSGSFTVALDEVALLETNVVQYSSSAAALVVVTGISAVMTGFCIANPKACFGSCPTFYVSDGREARLQAEGFSSSVAPSLEARDIDALYRVNPDGREFIVTMKNEALETHVVRHVRLLAAKRPAGGRVFATVTGEFLEATALHAVELCRADEGDCSAKVRAFDSDERFSTTDAEDLWPPRAD